MIEQEIDLLELAKKLKKYIFAIVAFAILVATLVYAGSKFVLTPKYTSNTTMIVGNTNKNNQENPQQNNVDYSQIQANRALVSTYSEIVKSRGVAENVIKNLNLDMDYPDFAKKVSIEPVNDTQIISVKVIDTIPERAADIANETSKIFKESITEIMKVDNVQILDKATLPKEPSSPNIMRNTAIGLVLGFLIGLTIAIFKELSDTSIKTTDDIREKFDIPVLGMIPDKSKEK